MSQDKTPPHLRLNEKNHVEKPFLKQLETMPGLRWQIFRLEMGNGQTPQRTGREDFTQVIMRRDLEDALKRIKVENQLLYKSSKNVRG